MYYSEEIETNEAIAAADRALDCLYNAQTELEGARNWGVVDIIGGGWLTTMAKRNRMKKAQDQLVLASRALKSLSKELHDVRSFGYIDLGIDSFSGVADYFFDGLVADLYVQNRIGSALTEVSDTINKVLKIRDRLYDIKRQY